ncbi:MAG: hypothetical protein NE328_17720 [Lentisphaeraceae bacterium]|nr:hypothetical protein [Lentisphaeraceae bacterium]
MNKRIFVAAGFNTEFMGPGRKEFNPKAPMQDYEYYLKKNRTLRKEILDKYEKNN